MNYLAHLYISRNYPDEVSVGNFLADAVKGKKAILLYPDLIQTGIRIHREIDSFTDSHPMVKNGTRRLHGKYGKFAGIIVDVYYDHILADNWAQYSDIKLVDFAQSRYDLITTHWRHLPLRTQMWYHYMYQNNLLVNYAKENVVELVLKRMDQRLGSLSGMGSAIEELRFYNYEFTEEFKTFFRDIQEHVYSKFAIL